MLSDLSLEVLVSVACRRRVGDDVLEQLLSDERARRLHYYLRRLKGRVKRISDVIDPSFAESKSPWLDEAELAELVKRLYGMSRAKLEQLFNQLVIDLQMVMQTVLNVDPVVDVETNLTENLGKVYRDMVDSVEKMYECLKKVEASNFPDEVLDSAAEMRQIWGQLKLKLSHLIVSPLEGVLRELAREEALKRISLLVYARR